jgi:hypothetical protein
LEDPVQNRNYCRAMKPRTNKIETVRDREKDEKGKRWAS